MLDKIKATEPAKWAELVRSILLALVGVGWLALDEPTVNSVSTVVAGVVSVVLTKFVRKSVTPTAKLDNPEH